MADRSLSEPHNNRNRRALDARRVIEVGTSFGVSTIFLAGALRDDAAKKNDERLVIGTETEPGNGAHVRSIIGAAEDIEYTGVDWSQAIVAEAEQCNAALIANGSGSAEQFPRGPRFPRPDSS